MDNKKKLMGGTELMTLELLKRLPRLANSNEIKIYNYPHEITKFDKKIILWTQTNYKFPLLDPLLNRKYVDLIDYFVFVSDWQKNKYFEKFNIPKEKSIVIKNACIGITPKLNKPNDIIKLCYISAPHRGLDVLLDSWERLNLDNCELHVFSSLKLYAENNIQYLEEDLKYEHLYKKCNDLPNVHYRGPIPNDELREELPNFHILAYPNTYEEENSVAVLEALCGGLRVVVPKNGSLEETTEEWARLYDFNQDKTTHAKIFAEVLKEEIDLIREGKLKAHLINQVNEYGTKWNWDNRIKEWETFLEYVNNEPKITQIKSII